MKKKVTRKERSKLVAFYVDDEEKQIIVDGAYRNDMSVSDYCRKTLLNTSLVVDRFKELEKE